MVPATRWRRTSRPRSTPCAPSRDRGTDSGPLGFAWAPRTRPASPTPSSPRRRPLLDRLRRGDPRLGGIDPRRAATVPADADDTLCVTRSAARGTTRPGERSAPGRSRCSRSAPPERRGAQGVASPPLAALGAGRGTPAASS
jgi:hypothetical protein